MISVLALDGGLRRFGALLAQTDGDRHRAFRAGVFESEQRVDDFDIRLCDDRVRRTRELHRWLEEFTIGTDIAVVASEAMSFPRGAHAIVAVSLAWGVVASFLEDRRLPIETVMPSYWRSYLLDERPKKGGSAAQRKQRTEARERRAHARAVQIVPTAAPLIRDLRTDELRRHALDALGVFCWSLTSPTIRRLLYQGQS